MNPDFSQIESDAAQISANERFALFFPEKRPFFLEGIDLFATPIQAVYTRTVTSPRGGLRATGRFGSTSYTALVTHDRGGGLVVLPGPTSSDFGLQDFESEPGCCASSVTSASRSRASSQPSGSWTMADTTASSAPTSSGGRVRRIRSPASSCGATRARPTTRATRTVPDEWDGRRMQGHAAEFWYQHNDKHWDAFANYRDYGDDFRADVGFVPQVGFRELYAEGGYSRYPTKGFVSRQRIFLQADYVEDRPGALIQKFIAPGTGLDGLANSFLRFWIVEEEIRAVDASSPTGESRVLPRRRFLATLEASPWSWLTRVSLDGSYGKDVDFVQARPGHGGQVNFGATVRPTDHLQIDLLANHRWLDVDVGNGNDEPRLFTADVQRIKAIYTFNRRSFLRLIAQRQAGTQDPALSPFPVDPEGESIDVSALFAYKLNWQSVLFFGYQEASAWSPSTTDLEAAGRSLFLKVSYAFQR